MTTMSTFRRRAAALALGFSVLVAGAGCSKSNEPTLSSDTTVFSSAPASTPASTTAPVAQPAGVPDTIVKPKKPGKLAVYASPDASAQPSQQLDNPWLYNNEPNAKVPRVLAVKTKQDGWYEVWLPQRPNGSSGWVKAEDVTSEPMASRIEVRLGEFNLKAYKGDQVVLDTKIAVGSSDNPTPGGVYYTTVLIQPPNPKGDYGPYAWGLSGYSETLDSFNGGDGQLGIHGTNKPQLLGTQVSHGCIRLSNEDITKLVTQVYKDQPLGIPVQVFA